jgi:DNA-binding XRE family transcriptional regulator
MLVPYGQGCGRSRASPRQVLNLKIACRYNATKSFKIGIEKARFIKEQEKGLEKKAPNHIDRHIGGRVRARRIMLGMSQERLADALGLTFQQVQKYEKGVNRIGASRLLHIAGILDVGIEFFSKVSPACGQAGSRGTASWPNS